MASPSRLEYPGWAMRTALGVLCTIIAILAFAVGTVGLVEILSGLADAGGYGAFAFLSGIGGVSTWGAVRNFKAARAQALAAGAPGYAAIAAPVDPVKVVLELAAREGGRVTVTEVVAKTPLSLAQAHAALAELSTGELASSVVTEEGVEVFEILGLLAPAQKALARDMLDT
jgi:hypothetical protein